MCLLIDVNHFYPPVALSMSMREQTNPTTRDVVPYSVLP